MRENKEDDDNGTVNTAPAMVAVKGSCVASLVLSFSLRPWRGLL